MEIKSNELKEKIEKGEKVIIDFWAGFCGPCKIMKPYFENVSKQLIDENSDVQLYTFDVDSDREFVATLGIRSVPTIKGFANGVEVFSEVGLKQKNAILELTKKL